MSEKNPIRVFAAHSFEESDDYLRLFEFLEGVDHFFYINVSKPENVPTDGGMQAIKDELINQIKSSEAVFIFPSLFEGKTELVRFMMGVAKANKIGMIAIDSFGAIIETPAELIEECQEHVEWNDRVIVDAIRRQARGEDTSRWEVVDFPGFDADGPTD